MQNKETCIHASAIRCVLCTSVYAISLGSWIKPKKKLFDRLLVTSELCYNTIKGLNTGHPEKNWWGGGVYLL